MSIFTSLSGSNMRMNYGYLSYFDEIVIFLSDAVARQHRRPGISIVGQLTESVSPGF